MARWLMFSHFVRPMRKPLAPVGDGGRVTLWAKRAFDDFVVPDGEREKMFSTIADHALRLTRLAHRLETDEGKSELAKTLLNVCAWIDSGHVRLEGSKLRSYEDISIQVATLRRLVAY